MFLRSSCLALALVLGACAGVANTPQQILAYERWDKCGSAYVQLMGVSVDGRITFQFTSASDRDRILQCLADAGRGGTPLPEPAWVRPVGGQ